MRVDAAYLMNNKFVTRSVLWGRQKNAGAAESAGGIIAVQTVIDDLNVMMRCLSYCGRANAVTPASDADFGDALVAV